MLKVANWFMRMESGTVAMIRAKGKSTSLPTGEFQSITRSIWIRERLLNNSRLVYKTKMWSVCDKRCLHHSSLIRGLLGGGVFCLFVCLLLRSVHKQRTLFHTQGNTLSNFPNSFKKTEFSCHCGFSSVLHAHHWSARLVIHGNYSLLRNSGWKYLG